MKKNILIFCLSVLAVFCGNVSARENGTATDPDSKVRIGDTVPDFTAERLDGTKVSITGLRGKVVLINFWATWCGPCRAEFPVLEERINKEFEGEDFVLLAISRGEERKTVEKFRDDNPYGFDYCLDTDSSIYGLFATQYIPRNYLISPDGIIVDSRVGFSPESDDIGDLAAKIRSMLEK